MEQATANLTSYEKLRIAIKQYQDGLKFAPNEKKYVDDFFETKQHLFDGIDFNDEAVKERIQTEFEALFVKIDDNEKISYADAKLTHFLFAKSELARQGIKNYSISYRQGGNNECNPNGKRIVFNNTHFPSINATRLSPDRKTSYLISPNERKYRLCRNIISSTIHEVRHAKQFNEIEQAKDNPLSITPELYLMAKQKMVAEIKVDGGRYNNHNIYNDKTHDAFAFEIDANKEAFVGTHKLLKSIGQESYIETYDNTIEENFAYQSSMWKKKDATETISKNRQQLIKGSEKLYSDAYLQHSTNPNGKGMSTNHKTSQMLDLFIGHMSENDASNYIRSNPILNFTYHLDGTPKKLNQVEKARKEATNKILHPNLTEADIENINKVFDVAIESSPALSLEKSLKIITSPETKFPQKRESIYKSEELLTILEQEQYTRTKSIIAQYKDGLSNITLIPSNKLDEQMIPILNHAVKSLITRTNNLGTYNSAFREVEASLPKTESKGPFTLALSPTVSKISAEEIAEAKRESSASESETTTETSEPHKFGKADILDGFVSIVSAQNVKDSVMATQQQLKLLQMQQEADREIGQAQMLSQGES